MIIVTCFEQVGFFIDNTVFHVITLEDCGLKMVGKLGMWFMDQVARNLRIPEKGIFGWVTKRLLLKSNCYLEENAVRLCNIKPDHKVLEIGFGPGVGLEAAYGIVKNGSGRVYGIDTSFYMVDTAHHRMKKGVKEKKVILFHGSATQIPLNTDSVDRVFHCNCYYFWPSMRSVMREIYRVMRPGAIMITTLSLEKLNKAQKGGFMKYGHPDPVKYMTCLENYGFESVHMEYHTDPATGESFQAIFAEVVEKPAHDASMLSDDEDDEMEKEVEALLKERADHTHFAKKQPL